MTVEDYNCGIVFVLLFIAWLALDWWGHRTGELDEEEDDR